MSRSETFFRMLPNIGLIETKLNKEEMDYLWNLIENKKQTVNGVLAGNIHQSNSIEDRNNWFFKNTLYNLIKLYVSNANFRYFPPLKSLNSYYLHNMWVNFQKKGEFNPVHSHTGIFSFVIWMKIPTRHDIQNKDNKSSTKLISSFQFNYSNILGELTAYTIAMNPEIEGTLLLFPSKLSHAVYPFYDCDEDRISISGNIFDDNYSFVNHI